MLWCRRNHLALRTKVPRRLFSLPRRGIRHMSEKTSRKAPLFTLSSGFALSLIKALGEISEKTATSSELGQWPAHTGQCRTTFPMLVGRCSSIAGHLAHVPICELNGAHIGKIEWDTTPISCESTRSERYFGSHRKTVRPCFMI